MTRIETDVVNAAYGVTGRPTRSVCTDYKTLNKITLESHGSVRAWTGVPTCVTENGDDVDDEVKTRGKGRRRGRNVLATRCRHVAEERDGACLFKPILYRIFILMDFFNSVEDEEREERK